MKWEPLYVVHDVIDSHCSHELFRNISQCEGISQVPKSGVPNHPLIPSAPAAPTGRRIRGKGKVGPIHRRSLPMRIAAESEDRDASLSELGWAWHFNDTTHLQIAYTQERKRLELDMMGLLALGCSIGVLASLSFHLRYGQPVMLVGVYFMGAVISGVRMFPNQIVHESIARPLTVLWILVLLTCTLIVSMDYPRPLLAFVTIYQTLPKCFRTHFWTFHFVLNLFACGEMVALFRIYPELVGTYATIFIVAFFLSWNSELVGQRAFLETQRLVQSQEQNLYKQRALLQLQSQDNIGMRRLYHVVKNVLVGVAGVLESNELTEEDRAMCAGSLRQGIDFIQHRTAFSALAAGNYKPQLKRADFSTFFANVASPPSVKYRPRCGMRALAGSFETLLARCALVDTIANALSHGAGGARVEYWIDSSCDANPMLHVGVYNMPKRTAPHLTPERVEELFVDGETHGGGGDNSGMGLASVRFMLQVSCGSPTVILK